MSGQDPQSAGVELPGASSGHELRVTRQALEDLNVASLQLYVGRPAEDLVDLDVVIAKFVEQRRDRTTGQEPTLGVKPTTWNLHAPNPWRAVTWHDPVDDIVWLCAVTPHDYKEIVARSRAGRLLPSARDRADIEARRKRLAEQSFIEAGDKDAQELLALAEAAPGVAHSLRIADEIEVTLLVETLSPGVPTPADYYLVIHHPRAGRRSIDVDVETDLTTLFFLDAEDDELSYPSTIPAALGELLPGRDALIWWQRP